MEHPRLLNHFEWSIHVGLMGQLETAPPLKILDASINDAILSYFRHVYMYKNINIYIYIYTSMLDFRGEKCRLQHF